MMFFSLLKAALSQDMSMFKYNAGKNASPIKKIMLPVLLFLLVCYSVGIYAYEIGKVLEPAHLTYVMLSIFLMAVTIISFMEGIHKSQGILFEAKDNDLLFSLPIKKSQIITIRLIKLLLFQYIFNLMFILPAFAIYIYFENPGISFYIISLFMTFFIPIIPTIISCVLGYVIQMVSSKTKKRKLVQLLLTSLLLILFLGFSSNSTKLVESLAEHALSVHDLLTKIYYPIGAYTKLIEKFDLIIFIKLLLINTIPLCLFIVVGQKYYFRIISRLHNSYSSNSKKNIKITNKINSPVVSLTKKELSRYFSSPVYIFNTSFGLIMMIVITIILGIKGQDTLKILLSGYGVENNLSIEILYYYIIMALLMMTSISSSSISLEGKTISFTKTLPVDYKKIFISKILNCFVIEMPFVILSIVLFIIIFPVKIVYVLQLILLGMISVFYMGVFGLIVNLKYPKLNASSDTEVVKQSMSSMVSVFGGMVSFFASIFVIGYFEKFTNINYSLWIHLGILGIISLALYFLLMKTGPSKYQKLNV